MKLNIRREIMKVDLLPEDEKIIADKLASGMYVSRSEVVRDALRRLAAIDRDIALLGPTHFAQPPARPKARVRKRRRS